MNDFLYLNIILVDFFNIVSCVFKLFVDGTFSLKPVCSPKQKVFKIYIYNQRFKTDKLHSKILSSILKS